MNLTFTQPLKEYMEKKGYVAVTFETISAIGCCADTAELCAGFVKAADLEDKALKAWKRVDSPDGTMLLMTRGIEYDQDVTLGIRSFLGAKDVQTDNVRPWSFR